MSGSPVRKLATIFAADVVGYSQLMAEDDELTLRTLQGHREIIFQEVDRHRGRIFGTAGDSVMAEFPSPVEAIRGAAAVQAAIAARNAELGAPSPMQFRIGINLGDVISEGDDLFGDGVNVAARIEGLAAPGGISISGTVFDLVADKTDLKFDNGGEQRVKNIAKLIQVYHARIDGSSHAVTRRRRFRPLRAAVIFASTAAIVLVLAFALGLFSTHTVDVGNQAQVYPTVAVQKFAVIGAGPDEDVLSRGLREDLMITLTEVMELQLVSAVSAANQITANYAIEGTVRQDGGRVRITASLISTKTGLHLWGGRYDRSATDMLTLQVEVAQKIVSSLSLALVDAESDRMDPEQGGSLLVIALTGLGRLADATISLSMGIFGQGSSAEVVPPEPGDESDATLKYRDTFGTRPLQYAERR
jgi:class 3 adenylate cyclase/TolB-like protein